MRTATTLLFATGTLLVAGCSLIIGSELEDKVVVSAGSGGAGGEGGAGTASNASTTAGMMTTATAAVTAAQSASVGVSASSGGGCSPDCKLDHAKSDCVNGVCVVKDCDNRFDDCDQKPENGCETHLDNDALHCGSCDQKCTPPMNHCMDSKCK